MLVISRNQQMMDPRPSMITVLAEAFDAFNFQNFYEGHLQH